MTLTGKILLAVLFVPALAWAKTPSADCNLTSSCEDKSFSQNMSDILDGVNAAAKKDRPAASTQAYVTTQSVNQTPPISWAPPYKAPVSGGEASGSSTNDVNH